MLRFMRSLVPSRVIDERDEAQFVNGQLVDDVIDLALANEQLEDRLARMVSFADRVASEADVAERKLWDVKVEREGLREEREDILNSLRETAHREIEYRDRLALATLDNERLREENVYDEAVEDRLTQVRWELTRVAHERDQLEQAHAKMVRAHAERQTELARSRTRKRETELRAARNLALALNYREGMRQAEGRVAEPPTWIVKGWQAGEDTIRVVQADA